MEKKLPVKEIKVGKRVRKDFGDVKALAASIEKIGLLQAIAVTKQKRLICGNRRLRAVKSLRHQTIDCRILDINDLREAEHAENEFRKSLTLSEKAELAETIRQERGRRRSGGDYTSAKAKSRKASDHFDTMLSGNGEPPTRAEVAIQAGFTGHQEMDRVTKATENGVAELVEAMDAGFIKPSKAAEIAMLPKKEQEKILKDARQEDGTYKFTKPSAVTKKGPSHAEVWLNRFDDHLATANGLREKHKTIAGLFDSDVWQRNENKQRIGEFVDKVQMLADFYSDLHDECTQYCRKHNI